MATNDDCNKKKKEKQIIVSSNIHLNVRWSSQQTAAFY